MLTLYVSPGACSMAAHIVLEESGAKYQSQQIHFANAEQRSEAYLRINPQGRVPTLVLHHSATKSRSAPSTKYLSSILHPTL